MKIEERCINTIRFLSADGVQKANSGHPGLPMGCAAAAHTVWNDFMNFNPDDPEWINRDRFVLSAGHGSMLLYSLLHLNGFDVSLDDLKNFRQYESKTPGHPEYGHTKGVDITTGPLGQGLSGAVGMAIAQEMLAAKFNKKDMSIIDNYTYVIAGDGDMMEGVTSEACSLAGHLKLGKLICLYDDNKITIDGCTSLAFSDDTAARYESYGWQVLNVDDGNDYGQIAKALEEAKKCTDKPSFIVVKTIIGYGSPNKQGTEECHGAPLGQEELKAAKENLDWYPDESFYIPDDVKEYFDNAIAEKKKAYSQWKDMFAEYEKAYPEAAKEFCEWTKNDFDEKFFEEILEYKFKKEKNATRNSGGEALNHIAEKALNIVGGSADLNPSTKTYIKSSTDFTSDNPSGRNIRFGVREHAMAAIMNGIALYGGLRVFGSTFFVFSDYMKPSLRLAALMKLPVVHVFTHDSIGVGEDGPTHQPVEHLAALRSIPNMTVIRPADAYETLHAWVLALKNTQGPTSIVLTRQNLPHLNTDYSVEKGAYVIGETYEKPDLVLMASGSEVQHIVKAKEILENRGHKVQAVSFPSFEIFEKQQEEYKQKVLPSGCVKRVAVEAGSEFGWHRYTGCEGRIICMEDFGASAPGDLLMEKFGFTPDNIVKVSEDLIS